MEHRPLRIRIRPQRVAILLAEGSGGARFMRAVELLSALWAGRYCSILPVLKRDKGVSAERALACIRPDIVFCLGVAQDKWARVCKRSCQPHGVSRLTAKEVQQYTQSRMTPTGLIKHISSVLGHLDRAPLATRKRVKLGHVPRKSPFSPFIAATIGLVPNDPKRYADTLKAEYVGEISPRTVSQYFKFFESAAEDYSWLDVTG